VDEEHFIYVDSGKDDGGELGRLMHDFRVKEAKEMQAGALKDRVHELKETEKGVEHMCKEMEALRLEGVEEGRLEEKRENAKSMAEDGMTVDRIAKILKVNAQMVQEWLAGSVSTAR
jgi:predicted transposase/invertase (TIGR01784 family)